MTFENGVPLVYIAGPYTAGSTELNVSRAIMYGEELVKIGVHAIVPHLFHFWHDIYPHDYETWMSIDKNVLSRCDAVLRISGDSTGADEETEYADQLGIPVMYSVQEVLEWVVTRE